MKNRSFNPRLLTITLILTALTAFIGMLAYADTSSRDSSPPRSFAINMNGLKDALWGQKLTISTHSSRTPKDFNLDGGLYVKENINDFFIGLPLDPDPYDGPHPCQLEILIRTEATQTKAVGGPTDPFNTSENRLKFPASAPPQFIIAIQWDATKKGGIQQVLFAKWDAESGDWLRTPFSASGGEIAAGGKKGIGHDDPSKDARINKQNTWCELRIPREALGNPAPASTIYVAALLKPDEQKPGVNACIPRNETLVSDWGNRPDSAFTRWGSYKLLEHPLPAKVLTTGGVIISLVDLFSQWCIPLIIFAIACYAYFVKRVKVYEVFVDGAKEGFNVAVMIIPYLVAILFAIGMFRAGGAEGLFVAIVKPVTSFLGMPPSILPLAFIRPLTGGGARALMLDIFHQYGPDSIDGLIASCIQGSTETTFYVIAVYLGSIGVKRTRYAVPACLIGDFCGMVASVAICRLWSWPF